MRSRHAERGEMIFCSSLFSLRWPGKMVKTKKDTGIRKQTNAAGQRNKQKKARPSNCAWLTVHRYFNVPQWVRRFVDIRIHIRVSVIIPVITVEFTNSYRTFFYSWLEFFARLAIASSAWRTFGSFLIDVHSFILIWFRFFANCFLRGLCLLRT